jgi:hypothetical protein
VQDTIKAGGGRGVLSPPPIRGKSLTEIHGLLQGNGFKALSPPPAGHLEMWVHEDGSLVRVAQNSGAKRQYLMIKKEITTGAWKSKAADVLVKVTDDGLVAPKELLGPDSDAMRRWFQGVAGKLPTPVQQSRMEQAWAIMTHIPVNP